MNRALLSGVRQDYRTPDDIIERVLLVLGRIDLDPCSDSATTPNVPAGQHYTKAQDGLSRAWHGKVYMNPPYGRGVSAWVDKLCNGFELGSVTEAVALLPARTDTRWFRYLRDYPRCFLHGRLRFKGLLHNAPFPSMAVYLGSHTRRFVDVFRNVGDTYVRVKANVNE